MKKKNLRFYLSCPLRLEDELLQELQEVWPYLLELDGRNHSEPLQILEQGTGGIEISAPLHLGVQLNSVLRLAHRVLLRLDSFPVRDFPVLEKRLFGVSLKEHLGDEKFSVEVSASRSRLNNEKRIAETCSRVWKKQLVETAEQKVLIRVFDDEMTISLDTTGEHLHFRGLEKQVGIAPLRETLAAFCLRRLNQGYAPDQLSKVELIDPMLGSGTYLSEAMIKDSPLLRSFSFQQWKSVPAALKLPAWAKNYRLPQSPYGALTGFDHDPEQLNASRDFFSKLNAPALSLGIEDVFEDSKSNRDLSKACFVITNPPYGERLESAFSVEELMDQILAKFAPQRLGILWPENQTMKLQKSYSSNSTRFQLLSQSAFKNGGLAVVFSVYEKIAG